MAINPIGFASDVVEEFRRYQLTAFPLADPRLAEQARSLLAPGFSGSPLVKGPYLSIARAFETGRDVSDLIESGVLHPAMEGVAAYSSLFAHQQEALEAVKEGHHVLVSTGTGSGKTEAFLYPILDHCLRLRDEEAPPGVVAILMYPMNALAGDQRDRLRAMLAGSGITFGMYVGSTPHRTEDAGVVRLPEGTGPAGFAEARRRSSGETITPWEECVSEIEIAERKPRILITNANQLELLLTRGRDLGLFTDAPLRFLVLDEAHTYSGAEGAEVAVLVRRLRAFAGKSPDDVTAIATSATIVNPQAGTEVGPEFLARLFGVPETRCRLVSEQYVAASWPAARYTPPPVTNPAIVLAGVLQGLETGDLDALGQAVASLTGRPVELAGDWRAALYDHLAANEVVRALADELEKPLALVDTVERVWERLARSEPGEEAGLEILAYLALGAAGDKDGTVLLRPKMHLFVRGLEGAAAVFDGDPAEPRLYFSAEAAQQDHPALPLAAIYPVAVCRQCGQHYFETWLHDFGFDDRGRPEGGNAEHDANVWQPGTDGEDAVSKVRFTDRFLVEIDADDDDGTTAGRLDQRRVEMFLCQHCGSIHAQDGARCSNPLCRRTGPLIPVFVVIEGGRFRCVQCGENTRTFGGRPIEPIRPLRAVTVNDVHVLAQEMVNAAPSDEEANLLVFSDNRQDAAFQAGWMRDHARRHRLRYLILEAIRSVNGPVSVGDIHARLYRTLSQDRDLARALAPEAFASSADEAFGSEQKAALRRLLRIHVIRELAVRPSRWESLERWGQIRVVYAGLESTDERVQRAARAIGRPVDEIVDMAATLLDEWRRRGLLYDPDEPIFSIWWREGDEDIQRGFVPAGMADYPPSGVKFERLGGDDRVKQVVSERGRTSPEDLMVKWGFEDHPREPLEVLWNLMVELRLVVPVQLRGGRGTVLNNTAGSHQVAAANLGVVPQGVRYQCNTCQLVYARPTPGMVCPKRFCPGALTEGVPPEDDYNVSLLTRSDTRTLLPEEHTAQVPADIREEIEREFKKADGAVNTLVATPTLELGVDIGDLDLVLLRNVPPTAANYWQRVGRAGRRHRMAVLLTYARRAIHDAYFFEDPLRMLEAAVRPPRFNLKNDVMVAKHVHAVVISELLRLQKQGLLSDAESAEFDTAFPQFIRGHLFDEDRQYRLERADLSGLRRIIGSRRDPLLVAVDRVFSEGWPPEAAEEVRPEILEKLVDGMADELAGVINRIKDRMRWTVETRRQLLDKERSGLLDEDEIREKWRCDDYLRRLAEKRQDTYTLTALANEGFLPGYGTYGAGITAFAPRPVSLPRARSFELSRAPAVALREYVPGNLLYANRGRFRTRRYHLSVGREGQLERYAVHIDEQRIARSGEVGSGYADVAPLELEALPISDLDLGYISPIRDEEQERFAMPVTVLGTVRNARRGGRALKGGAGPIHHLFGQGLRLVNVGPASEVRQSRLGFPVCRICGATRSPYSSQRELDNFREWHTESCGTVPTHIGFYADVTVDALRFQSLIDAAEAANLGEALRIGASQVLEMEPDDLQTLTVPNDDQTVDLFLYDPMAGGSGLLDQILERWTAIVDALRPLLSSCPGACETSCYECLRTGRNTFYHRLLDRNAALDVIDRYSEAPEFEYELPPQVEVVIEDGSGTNTAEDRLARMLDRAGLTGFAGQQDISVGPPYDRTVPDFAYVDEAGGVHVAVYLDGLSKGIHGDPVTAQKDAIIRGQLEDQGWTVVEIAASHLDDPMLINLAFRKIARAIGGQEHADGLEEPSAWMFDGVEQAAEPVPRPSRLAEVLSIVPREEAEPYVRHLPVYSLQAAAGAFLENEPIEEEGWVEVSGMQLREGMFAATVRGVSMEPRIPNGSLVAFRGNPGGGPIAGSRAGRIVLAALYGPEDPEGGGSFTVKRYRSERVRDEDGSWRHERIVLESLNPEVSDIELSPDDGVSIVAEFVRTLAP